MYRVGRAGAARRVRAELRHEQCPERERVAHKVRLVPRTERVSMAGGVVEAVQWRHRGGAAVAVKGWRGAWVEPPRRPRRSATWAAGPQHRAEQRPSR